MIGLPTNFIFNPQHSHWIHKTLTKIHKYLEKRVSLPGFILIPSFYIGHRSSCFKNARMLNHWILTTKGTIDLHTAIFGLVGQSVSSWHIWLTVVTIMKLHKTRHSATIFLVPSILGVKLSQGKTHTLLMLVIYSLWVFSGLYTASLSEDCRTPTIVVSIQYGI